MKNISIDTLDQYASSPAANSYLTTQIENNTITQNELNTLIHNAVRSNKKQAYQHLLDYFKSFPAFNIEHAKKSLAFDGKTLLHEAVIAQNIELYQELLSNVESGINPFIRDNDRYSAADYAYQQAINHPDDTSFALLQRAIDHHTAIDVTWLRLPENIHIENALMVGHIVQKNSAKNHLYDIKSIQNILGDENVKQEEHLLIANRIAQFLRVSSETELSNVNKVLQDLSHVVPKATIQKEISIKDDQRCIDLNDNDNSDFVEIIMDQINPDHLTQEEFLAQLTTLQLRLELINRNFSAMSTRHSIQPVNDSFINATLGISLWIFGLTLGLTAFYNVGLGMAALWGVLPKHGDCIEYDNDYPNGKPRTQPICTDWVNLGTQFNDNDWANMATAAIYPNLALAIVIALTVIARLGARPAANFTEKSREKLEDIRQLGVANQVKATLSTFLNELVQHLPELESLFNDLTEPEHAEHASLKEKLKITPQKIQAISTILKSQAENLLPQSKDLAVYPVLKNVSLFKLLPVNKPVNEKSPLINNAGSPLIIN